MTLAQEKCTPCSGDEPKVTDAEAEALLREIPQWEIRDYDGVQHLVRTFEFKQYADGLRFTVNVGELADDVNHHPTLITVWGKVTVHWWTHAIDGLHKTDFIMAARTDEIYREFA